jgi:hypothetical protein
MTTVGSSLPHLTDLALRVSLGDEARDVVPFSSNLRKLNLTITYSGQTRHPQIPSFAPYALMESVDYNVSYWLLAMTPCSLLQELTLTLPPDYQYDNTIPVFSVLSTLRRLQVVQIRAEREGWCSCSASFATIFHNLEELRRLEVQGVKLPAFLRSLFVPEARHRLETVPGGGGIRYRIPPLWLNYAPHLKQLNLRSMELDSIDFLRKMTKLETLFMGELVTSDVDDLCNAIGNCSCLTELALEGVPLDASQCEHLLRRLPRLVNLTLNTTRLTSVQFLDDVPHIAKTLRRLTFHGAPNLGDLRYERLVRLQALEYLMVNDPASALWNGPFPGRTYRRDVPSDAADVPWHLFPLLILVIINKF